MSAQHPLPVYHSDMGVWTSHSVSLDMGSPSSSVDALEMRSAVGTGVSHSGDRLVTTDWFLWRLMDGCLFIQQVMC